MKTKKIMCVALAAMMLFGSAMSVVGCGKKITGSNVIQKNDPWYSGTNINIDEVCDYSEYNSSYSYEPMIVGDHILVPVNAYGTKDDETKSASDLCVLDLNGKLIHKMTLGGGTEGIYKDILGCAVEDGKTVVYLMTSSGMSNKYSKVVIDPESGEAGEEEETELKSEVGNYISYFDYAGEFSFYVSMGDTAFLHIMKNGEEVASVDLVKELGTNDVYMAGRWEEDNRICIEIGSTNGLGVRISIDKKSNKIDSEKIDNMSDTRMIIGSDGRSYEARQDGIYIGDEPYLMYSDCDANIAILAQSRILSVDGDRIVMLYSDYDQADYSVIQKLILLEKADKNPNAGKEIITASAAYFNVEEMVGEGIRKFNNENGKYFIRTTCDEFDFSQGEEDADYEKYSDEFKMKLLSNEAPDIIFGANNISGIQNDEYLADLSKYVELSPDKYFTNITDSMAKDGKLYVMPLEFGVEGIVTEKANVKDGATGFTFDEYKDFVDKACNGKDPVSDYYKRNEYFAQCLMAMDELWLKDGKADFDTEEFRQMANFIRDNVAPDPVSEGDDNGVDIMSYDESIAWLKAPAKYSFIFSFTEFENQTSELRESSIYGLPSSDGRGPQIGVASTIAINAASDSKEGCADFIKSLLDPEIQKMGIYNPLSKEACEEIIDEDIEKLKANYERISKYGIFDGVINPKDGDKDEYMNMLQNLNVYSDVDESIYTIIKEEGSAFFSSDMSVDDLIKNLNNRVQTVLNESK